MSNAEIELMLIVSASARSSLRSEQYVYYSAFMVLSLCVLYRCMFFFLSFANFSELVLFPRCVCTFHLIVLSRFFPSKEYSCCLTLRTYGAHSSFFSSCIHQFAYDTGCLVFLCASHVHELKGKWIRWCCFFLHNAVSSSFIAGKRK